MLPVLVPVACFLAGCIAAMFTRSKLYAIVLPGLLFLVFSIVSFITSIGLDEFGYGVALGSPYVVAGFFMAMMYAGFGALIVWQIRGAPVPAGLQPPSKALLRHLGDPISIHRYCDKYGVTRAEVEAAIGAGRMKAFSERGIDFVKDEPPLKLSTTQDA